ncbi:MAG TPA: MFS transporter [Chloroflexota bacterium]
MSTAYADTTNMVQEVPPRPARWQVLRSRAFLVLLGAQGASLLGDFFNYVAVAWLVLQLTGSNLAVGAVLAAASVPRAILMLLGGAVSDRFSPRTSMLVGGFARALVMGILAGLALTHTVQLWHLFVGSFLIGIIAAFFLPASTSMLPRIVPSEQLEAGNAFMTLSRFGATVLGPALGGVLVAVLGAGAALAADAAGYALAGLLVIALPSGHVAANGSGKNALQDIWEGVVHVWNDVPLRTVLAVIAVVNLLGLPGIQVGLPALAYERFALGAVALGGGFAAFGLGAVAGALVASALPAPRLSWLMVGTAVVFGAGLAVVGLAPTLPLLLLALAVMGVVAGASNPYLISWLQRRTDPSMQGRMMSLVMLASVGLEPVGLALGGVVAERNLDLLFWGAGALIALIGVIATLSRSVRAE